MREKNVLNAGLPMNKKFTLTTTLGKHVPGNCKTVMFPKLRYPIHWSQDYPVLSQLFSTVQKSQLEIQSRDQQTLILPGSKSHFCFLSKQQNYPRMKPRSPTVF